MTDTPCRAVAKPACTSKPAEKGHKVVKTLPVRSLSNMCTTANDVKGL